MKLWALLTVVCLGGLSPVAAQPPAASVGTDFAAVNRYVQERSAKIYGAGGFEQLEAYQSGFVVSAEGHIATVSSLVLDRDEATVILWDGRKYTAKLVGTDPVTDVALLKIDVAEEEFAFFDLERGNDQVAEGERILAFSNLYNVATGDEPVSVLQGVVAAIAPLQARRGAFSTRFRGEVYVLDAPTNNPGAAGGVLVDLRGVPLGMLGKEVRSQVTGTWLNYALPLSTLTESVDRIRAGQTAPGAMAIDELPDHPATFASLGFRLVPNVVSRTPPYVDEVRPNSPAALEGIRPDDLVVAIGGTVVASYHDVVRALERTPGDKPVMISLLRGDRLLEIEVTPAAAHGGARP